MSHLKVVGDLLCLPNQIQGGGWLGTLQNDLMVSLGYIGMTSVTRSLHFWIFPYLYLQVVSLKHKHQNTTSLYFVKSGINLVSCPSSVSNNQRCHRFKSLRFVTFVNDPVTRMSKKPNNIVISSSPIITRRIKDEMDERMDDGRLPIGQPLISLAPIHSAVMDPSKYNKFKKLLLFV